MATVTPTSGVHEIKRYNKPKLSVAIEREGHMHTLMIFECEERALADQMYQEALITHVDDFKTLTEKYSALRAGMPSTGAAKSSPSTSAAVAGKEPMTTKQVKQLIDEAETIGRGLKKLRESAATANALVNKTEAAYEKAWAAVEAAVEELKHS